MVAHSVTTLPTTSPAYCRPLAYGEFVSAVEQLDTLEGLFHAAFAISLHDRPDGRIEEAASIVDDLAAVVRKRVHSSAPQAMLAHLHDVLFDVVGFCGNAESYYEPANSYVGEVLKTQRGIPISLVLVYKLVANELGIVVHGINAPGHFLAGVESSLDNLMFVDPFYGGGLLSESEVFERIVAATGRDITPAPDLLAKASHRQWLARMLHNLQALFARSGRERDQLAMQELEQLL